MKKLLRVGFNKFVFSFINFLIYEILTSRPKKSITRNAAPAKSL